MQRLIEGRPDRGMLLLGLRGVGKTVLLNLLQGMAIEQGFSAVKIEAPEGGALAQLLVPALTTVLYDLKPGKSASNKARTALSVLRNFAASFKVRIHEIEISLEPAHGQSESGDMEQDLADLVLAVAVAAAERGRGLAVLVDEVQYLSEPELAGMIVACHRAQQQSLPLLLVGAGLPQIAALAGDAKSYAERLFTFPDIGPLDAVSARAALVEPARKLGVEFDRAALDQIVKVSEGYPYFLQEWGSEVWNFAPSSPISAEAVATATSGVVARLDASFFRVRFDRLTPLQQKYLRAMAELGPGPYQTGDIARELGTIPNQVGPVRAQLIRKGMIWSQRYGETAFTVPLFDQFMKRQMPRLEKHHPRPRKRT